MILLDYQVSIFYMTFCFLGLLRVIFVLYDTAITKWLNDVNTLLK